MKGSGGDLEGILKDLEGMLRGSLKVDSVFHRIFAILLTCHFTSILHPFPNIFVRIWGESGGILKGFGGDLEGIWRGS